MMNSYRCADASGALDEYNRLAVNAYDRVVLNPLTHSPEERINPWAMSKAIYQTNKILKQRIKDLDDKILVLEQKVQELQLKHVAPVPPPPVCPLDYSQFSYKSSPNPLYGPFGPVTAYTYTVSQFKDNS